MAEADQNETDADNPQRIAQIQDQDDACEREREKERQAMPKRQQGMDREAGERQQGEPEERRALDLKLPQPQREQCELADNQQITPQVNAPGGQYSTSRPGTA